MAKPPEVGKLYQLPDGTKVTFVRLEQHNHGSPQRQTVARVILAAGYNPTEAEPVQVRFVQPNALQTIQDQKNTMGELT